MLRYQELALSFGGWNDAPMDLRWESADIECEVERIYPYKDDPSTNCKAVSACQSHRIGAPTCEESVKEAKRRLAMLKFDAESGRKAEQSLFGPTPAYDLADCLYDNPANV